MKIKILILIVASLMTLALASCSDDNPTDTPNPDPTNTAPEISSITSDPTTVGIGLNATVTCTASDPESDDLSYAWTSTAGTITGTSSTITWTAPSTTGTFSISCNVSDGDETANDSVNITVFETVVPGAMVLVQGGTFPMGDSYSAGNMEEIPVHSVTLGDFHIGKYEVTQAEWSQYMTAPVYGTGSGDQYPVYSVSWFNLILFCNYKSMDEGFTPCYTIDASTDPSDWPSVPIYSSDASFSSWNAVECNWSANGYRLPTEAEWEYAARGGSHFADDYSYSGSQTVDDVAWSGNNAPSASQSIGTKLSNQLGLYDMSGNVYEFCWDWFGNDYYTTCNNSGTVTDPLGVATGEMRVLRGGSWGGDAANCRVAGRFRDYPVSAFSHSGFRLVRKP